MPDPTLLAFQSHGPADARTIVFLHGGGVGGWMWNPVTTQLPDFHCLAPDQPEHGGSSGIGPFSIGLAAEKVADLIRRHAHGDRACVVGLSQGAQIAVQLLATAPELIETAMVSSALLRAVPGMTWASTPALLAWTYRLTVRPLMGQDWWIRLNMKYAAGVPEQYFIEFKHDFQHLSESEFVNLLAANQRFRLPQGLEGINTPTLVIAGRRELASMKQSARDLVNALPCSTGGLLNLGPDSTMAKEHNWALTAPELFARTVRAWLEQRPLPTEIEALPR